MLAGVVVIIQISGEILVPSGPKKKIKIQKKKITHTISRHWFV